jgi:hypothetical protein
MQAWRLLLTAVEGGSMKVQPRSRLAGPGRMQLLAALRSAVRRVAAAWRPTLATLLVEVPLALAVISALLLASMAAPGL